MKQDKPKSDTIMLENGYFERINSAAFQSLLKKSPFEDTRPRYWLGKILDKIVRESKYYFDAKRDLIKKFSIKHEKDGEEKDTKGKVIRKWKKGDPEEIAVGSDSGTRLEDPEGFRMALRELQEVEIDLKEPRIKVDEAPDVPLEEMMLLVPLLEEKKDFKKKEKSK